MKLLLIAWAQNFANNVEIYIFENDFELKLVLKSLDLSSNSFSRYFTVFLSDVFHDERLSRMKLLYRMVTGERTIQRGK